MDALRKQLLLPKHKHMNKDRLNHAVIYHIKGFSWEPSKYAIPVSMLSKSNFFLPNSG